jgi:hypothetical protein
VEQLEKEKREQSERTRIIAKRLDHVERAYRKEERPLLAKDYEIQQAEDLIAHNKAAGLKLQTAKDAHASALQNKKRLSRMMDDYKAKRVEIAKKRGEEYAHKREEAGRKIEEEKAQRRKALAQAREEERRKTEELERKRREEMAEVARLEQGVPVHLSFPPRFLIHFFQNGWKNSVGLRRLRLRSKKRKRRPEKPRKKKSPEPKPNAKRRGRNSRKRLASSGRERKKRKGGCWSGVSELGHLQSLGQPRLPMVRGAGLERQVGQVVENLRPRYRCCLQHVLVGGERERKPRRLPFPLKIHPALLPPLRVLFQRMKMAFSLLDQFGGLVGVEEDVEIDELPNFSSYLKRKFAILPCPLSVLCTLYLVARARAFLCTQPQRFDADVEDKHNTPVTAPHRAN